MLSIQKCKKELEKNGNRYSEIEIEQIREILYRLATIQYESNKLKTAENEARGNRNGIYTCIDRQTS